MIHNYRLSERNRAKPSKTKSYIIIDLVKERKTSKIK